MALLYQLQAVAHGGVRRHLGQGAASVRAVPVARTSTDVRQGRRVPVSRGRPISYDRIVRTMRVVSDRDLGTSTILNRYGPGPCLRGPGPQRLWCGHCGELVLEGVDPERFADTIFRCHCGAYNRPLG